LTDFDFMADKITTNYAGYDTKVTDANRAALSDLTTRLRAKAGEASDGELTALLTEWSGFFHEGHAALIAAYPRRWWRVLHNTEQIPIS
jgi:hypothetical protein